MLVTLTLVQKHVGTSRPACEHPHGPFDGLKRTNDGCLSSLRNQRRHSHMYTSQHGLVYKTISVTSTNKPSLYLIEKVVGFQSIHIFLKNVLSIYSTGEQK